MSNKKQRRFTYNEESELRYILKLMESAPKEALPSKYWQLLNRKNIKQLRLNGYNNFKRTIALNYFTWLVLPNDPQIKFLLRNIPRGKLIKAIINTISSLRHHPLNFLQSKSYTFLTLLLWEWALKKDKKGLLNYLEEPLVGNPPRVISGARLISQDLANSFLEFNSIFNSRISNSKIKTIIELGPGYGRTAYVFLRLIPHIRYILVDIPPALYIAQRYLSQIFPTAKIFRVKIFKNFSEVRSDFEKSDIIFLLPQQLNILPPNYADLFINISSLHEMNLEQIYYYFKQIERLTRHYCYLKEWKVSVIPEEDIIIRESDYPIPKTWERMYWRQCDVQSQFFEALFQTKNKI